MADSRSLLHLITACCLFGTAQAQDPSSPSVLHDFSQHVRPILKERCFACHGALKQESGLRLDTAAAVLQGGSSGPAAVANDASSSEILRRITSAEASVRMPPEGRPLTPEQSAVIAAWINAGALLPSVDQPEPDPLQHWSFRPPQRPTLAADAAHPIDALLQPALDAAGIQPLPVADRATLLRRATLDLIGVPPTPDELRAFLADDSPEAFSKVLDRLLSDPRYGERWARHWMDVWRYSDWYGRRHVPDVWNSAPQIWRWRDWIVQSLNSDHGYDRMLREMLAADEICPEDDQATAATGYLIRNWYALNPNDWMRNIVEHTGKAFMGLTFNCAHCHDHKYDPISQDDYFRLRAFFEPISIRQDRVPGEPDPGPFQEYDYGKLRVIQRLGMVRVFDKTPDAPTWFYTGGDERNRVRDRGSLAPGVPTFLADFDMASPAAINLPTPAFYPGLRPPLIEARRSELASALQSARDGLATTTAAISIPPELLNRVQIAEAAFTAATATAASSGTPTALSGQQSLLFDATSGRRILQHRLPQLKALPEAAALRFQLQLLTDTHFNFQLARDVVSGQTAGYVAFEQGRIVVWQPGSFTDVEAARYDFAGGQNRFSIELRIHPAEDRCLLNVHALPSGLKLVDSIPVGLNSWNPSAHPNQAFSFDARSGSRVLVDDVQFVVPGEADAPPVTIASFSFEAPLFSAESDAAGIDGWETSSFSEAAGVSLVSAIAGNPALQSQYQELLAARRAVAAASLPRTAAELQVAAATARRDSFEARVAADQAKYSQPVSALLPQLAADARRLEHAATLATAQSDAIAAELALARAEARPAEDPERTKQLEAATSTLATARKSLAAAMAVAATAAIASTATSSSDAATSPAWTPLGPEYPRTSTGRRKALAEWLTHPRHPLTARVAVNHIWLWHTHRPLVSSVSDFGRNGATPVNPQLLDWLAVEFMESGWSLKHLHRLILTSAAWQRSSTAGTAAATAAARDPENRLLWRMNPGRMEAEVVRDSLLAVAGLLDPQMGGQELENSDALTTYRRSLYYAVYPEQGGRSNLSELFDAPDPLDCYRRTVSIIPQQALALTNSELVHKVSGVIAEQLAAGRDQKARTFIVAAFQRILSRPPTVQEIQLCREFLQADDTADTRHSLIRALLNHNDFVTIR
ncbi:MAG: PSD1 and planctomycete cytochrome C domain-containing protein [Planctomycetota bacterium]